MVQNAHSVSRREGEALTRARRTRTGTISVHDCGLVYVNEYAFFDAEKWVVDLLGLTHLNTGNW